jgi:hypothetical protein
MVFNIEVSFNILKHTNVSEMEREIIDLATIYNCHLYYKLTEMENNLYRKRNHTVFVISFEDNDINNLGFFIKEIKKLKNIHIECLYQEDILCKLIYASQYYLTTIDKDKVNIYNNNKRKRAYSEDENMLINGITCKT